MAEYIPGDVSGTPAMARHAGLGHGTLELVTPMRGGGLGHNRAQQQRARHALGPDPSSSARTSGTSTAWPCGPGNWVWT